MSASALAGKSLFLSPSKVPLLKYKASSCLGITLVNKLLKDIVPYLSNFFDIEIKEIHHNKKLDAPSGTACMFLDTINKNLNYEVNYGRKGEVKRDKKVPDFKDLWIFQKNIPIK